MAAPSWVARRQKIRVRIIGYIIGTGAFGAIFLHVRIHVYAPQDCCLPCQQNSKLHTGALDERARHHVVQRVSRASATRGYAENRAMFRWWAGSVPVHAI